MLFGSGIRSMNLKPTPMLLVGLLLTTMNSILPLAAAEKDTRCYEMRTYYAAPGKLDDLHARFRDHTMEIFESHGMVNLGYWVPVDNKDNVLIYVLGYPSREDRDKMWKGFMADPKWTSAYKASTVKGRLVKKVDSVFLTATDYSPQIKVDKHGHDRLFELRRYISPAGKLQDLQSRFRDHTVELFTKHGMAQFAYWTPMDKKQGADNTLIYILAHESKEARDQSFAAFGKDPAWKSARAASEKNGSLTSKVESTLMNPTDYSPTR
jgi:hypothetical protein